MAASRLYGPALVATGPATVYTVPAAIKVVVRHIHVANTTAAAVTFTMSVGADAAGTRLFPAYSIAAGATLDFFCYLPMVATEIITLSAGANNILTVTIAGDLDAA